MCIRDSLRSDKTTINIYMLPVFTYSDIADGVWSNMAATYIQGVMYTRSGLKLLANPYSIVFAISFTEDFILRGTTAVVLSWALAAVTHFSPFSFQLQPS